MAEHAEERPARIPEKQDEGDILKSLMEEIILVVDRISLGEITSPEGVSQGRSLVSASLEIAEAGVERPGSITSDMIQKIVSRYGLPREKARIFAAIGILKGEHLERLHNFLRDKKRELEVVPKPENLSEPA